MALRSSVMISGPRQNVRAQDRPVEDWLLLFLAASQKADADVLRILLTAPLYMDARKPHPNRLLYRTKCTGAWPGQVREQRIRPLVMKGVLN
jgi:hypothetical protein